MSQPSPAPERFKPSVTVAAVVERGGLYLLVEERTPEGLRLNNPAGHLDAGESPQEACARECLEETAHPFAPTHLVGVYLSRFQRQLSAGMQDVTYLRMAFCGTLGAFEAGRQLDEPIERTLWMSLEELRASAARHRSPLVLRCSEDHAAGQRFALAAIHTDPSIYL